jgi:molybdate transport system substrate-binding protein
MISSMATRDLLRELAVSYQATRSQPVVSESAGGVDVAKRVQAGEAVDVVVLARNAIDKLAADGKVIATSRVDLVKSGIAVAVGATAVGAVAAGAAASGATPAQPDISSEAAVKRAVQSAKTLSYSTGPSGVYLEKIFERWGILEAIKPRIVVPPPGVPVGSLLASGKVELGFQQLSELMNLEGVTVLGMLPPEIQSMTTFSGAIATVSTAAAAAQAFLDFMASPDRAALKARHGMEPGTT